MSKVYLLSGSFLIGVSLSGAIAFTAHSFPNLRGWAFWSVIVAALIFVLLAVTDDYVSEWLSMPYRAYIASLLGLILTLVIGGLAQWR